MSDIAAILTAGEIQATKMDLELTRGSPVIKVKMCNTQNALEYNT